MVHLSDGRNRRLMDHRNGLVVRKGSRMSSRLLLLMLGGLRQGVVEGRRLMGRINRRSGLDLVGRQRGHGLVGVGRRTDDCGGRRQLHRLMVLVHLVLRLLLLLLLLMLLVLDLMLLRIGCVLVLGVGCGRGVLVLQK